MEIVHPIRNKKHIEAIKQLLMPGTRDYLMFVLGINSALRISDLLNLKVGDVATDKGPLANISVREKKTGKPKQFPVNNSSSKAIKLYLEKEKPQLTDYLFKSRKGENRPISRVQAWSILSNIAACIGIEENIGTHTLRKTFGYHTFKSGVGIETIQKILNHDSPADTLKYIGITQDDINSVYMNLNL
ncbi:MAG: site-specific integrase [Candidatus Omnitrophota bacterium]